VKGLAIRKQHVLWGLAGLAVILVGWLLIRDFTRTVTDMKPVMWASSGGVTVFHSKREPLESIDLPGEVTTRAVSDAGGCLVGDELVYYSYADRAVAVVDRCGSKRWIDLDAKGLPESWVEVRPLGGRVIINARLKSGQDAEVYMLDLDSEELKEVVGVKRAMGSLDGTRIAFAADDGGVYVETSTDFEAGHYHKPVARLKESPGQPGVYYGRWEYDFSTDTLAMSEGEGVMLMHHGTRTKIVSFPWWTPSFALDPINHVLWVEQELAGMSMVLGSRLRAYSYDGDLQCSFGQDVHYGVSGQVMPYSPSHLRAACVARPPSLGATPTRAVPPAREQGGSASVHAQPGSSEGDEHEGGR
jgi:hypothetical protein